MQRFAPASRRLCLVAFLLAALLLLGGCGGEFWGGVGNWEPDELGALPIKINPVLTTNSQGVPGG